MNVSFFAVCILTVAIAFIHVNMPDPVMHRCECILGSQSKKPVLSHLKAGIVPELQRNQVVSASEPEETRYVGRTLYS